MKLTPLDIHHKEFRRALRGYNEEDVDVFLDEVAEEFERLFKENIELKEQMEKTQGKIEQYEGIEDTLQRTLLVAQKSAEEVKAHAAEEAEQIIKDAESKARETLQDVIKEKEKLQGSFNELKKAEKDFRVKFRSLLESFLTMVNEIEGGMKPKKGVEPQEAVKEQRPVPKGKEEEELARLLDEIRTAKSEMGKRTVDEEAADSTEDLEEENEVEAGVELEEEDEKMSEAKPQSRRRVFGKKKDAEDDIEEIS